MSNRRRLSSGSSGLVGLTLEDENDEELDAIAIATSYGGSFSSFNGGGSRNGSRRRSSFGGSLSLNKSPQKNSAEQARIAEMYKTVIKLSSENKINEKNSWSLDLIDHMGKLIKEDSGSRGVNFQKASCTLDASVKIYSHRVDDTHASSHRILESLSRNGTGDDDDSNGDRGNAKVGSHSSSHRLNIAETIEKKVEKINDNNVDKAQATDPLFHKMSKAFDEGGAKGMLMNNLRVTSQGSCLVFNVIAERGDDGKVLDKEKDDNTKDSVDDKDNSKANANATTDAQPTSTSSVQTSTTQSSSPQFINISDLIYKSGFTAADLESMDICSHLDEYRSALGVKPSDAGLFEPTMFDQYFSTSAVPVPSSSFVSENNRFTPSKPVVGGGEGDATETHNDFGGAGDDYGCAYDDDDDDDDNGVDMGGAMFDETNDPNPNQNLTHSPMKPRASIGGRLSLAGKDAVAAKISWDTVFDSSSSSSSSSSSGQYQPVESDGEVVTTSGEGVDNKKENIPAVVMGEIVTGNDYSFFPSLHLTRSQANSWAGAKHWKFGVKSHTSTTSSTAATAAASSSSSNPSAVESQASSSDTPAAAPTATAAVAKRGGKKKESFTIDFTGERVSEDLFAAPKGRGDPTSLTAAAIEKASLAAENGDLLLPADAHVQVTDMFRLFLCTRMLFVPPSLSSSLPPSMVPKGGKTSNWAHPSNDILWGSVSQKLTHSHTESITHSISTALNRMDDDDDEFAGGWGDGGVGYDDDDDDNHHDSEYPTTSSSSSNLPPAPPSPQGLQFSGNGLVQASRKVEKVNIGYATTAKRVNVRKLKHDIWHWIDGSGVDATGKSENENPNENSTSTTSTTTTSSSVPEKKNKGVLGEDRMSFHTMVDELGSSMREGVQKEATLPFYFICLLHLANEKGLCVKSVESMDDLIISREV